MRSFISDAALFLKHIGGNLEGMCRTYVDDILHAGTEKYQYLIKITEEKFKCKEREYDKFKFSGLQTEN